MSVTVHHGDCRAIIATLPDASVDSIVTDPPYELGFMGKRWDASGIAYDVDLWAECLRVLKPGGHLLAFGGTRTYHRMTVAIEDAGFEIRDSIHWLYGSGFPKSLDVSKAIDKQRHDRADVYRVTAWIREARDAAGIGNRDIDNAFGFAGMAGHWTSAKSQPAVPTLEQVPTLLDVLGVTLDDVPDDIRRLLWELNGRKGQPGENWAKREVVGTATGAIVPDPTKPKRHTVGGHAMVYDITAPATDAARQWEGWGTALKPAHEPIVVARKPLAGTVAANVLEHGTGALNIDGCRVGYASDDDRAGAQALADLRAKGRRLGVLGEPGQGTSLAAAVSGDTRTGEEPTVTHAAGRWPANLVLTHAAECADDDCGPDCPVALLDQQSGERPGGNFPTQRGGGVATAFGKGRPTEGGARSMGDSGGASRFFTVTGWDPFFYTAKPSRRERNAGLDDLPDASRGNQSAWVRECGTCGCRFTDPATGKPKCKHDNVKFTPPSPTKNTHPTVKPLALMRWLVRLVTPPGGTVLDPFAGSGTTLAACVLEGFDAIGCEMTAEYLPIIDGRIAWAEAERDRPSSTRTQRKPEGANVSDDGPEQPDLFGGEAA